MGKAACLVRRRWRIRPHFGIQALTLWLPWPPGANKMEDSVISFIYHLRMFSGPSLSAWAKHRGPIQLRILNLSELVLISIRKVEIYLLFFKFSDRN